MLYGLGLGSGFEFSLPVAEAGLSKAWTRASRVQAVADGGWEVASLRACSVGPFGFKTQEQVGPLKTCLPKEL